MSKAFDKASQQCQLCPAGTERQYGVSLECTPCPAGTYSEEGGKCLLCPAGEVSPLAWPPGSGCQPAGLPAGPPARLHACWLPLPAQAHCANHILPAPPNILVQYSPSEGLADQTEITGHKCVLCAVGSMALNKDTVDKGTSPAGAGVNAIAGEGNTFCDAW